MKAEYWTIAGCAVFFAATAPIYWWLTYDPTGTTALHRYLHADPTILLDELDTL